MKTTYICPDCGHEFQQGEYNYNYDYANLEFECPNCGWEGTDSDVETDEEDSDMRSDILGRIINNAGSVHDIIILQQIHESDSEYRDRIYGHAHDLFMEAVAALGLDELNDEDEAPYDAIREDVIYEIVDMLMYGITPDGFETSKKEKVEFSLTIDCEISDEGIDCYMGDDIGGSGIKVKGKTPEEVAENLKSYILDYLYMNK